MRHIILGTAVLLLLTLPALGGVPELKQDLRYKVVVRPGDTGTSEGIQNICHSYEFMSRPHSTQLSWRIHGVDNANDPVSPGTRLLVIQTTDNQVRRLRNASSAWIRIEVPQVAVERNVLLMIGRGCDIP